MKYQDKRFQKFQEKQRDGIHDNRCSYKSERQIRRELEHYHSVTFSKFFSDKFDRDWWNCLTTNQRDSIISHYETQVEYIDSGFEIWANFELFETMNEWVNFIKKDYKCDMVKFRELKFKKIGI
jgi:hypothetical protein